MKAIVCVKQVPDTSGKVAVNPDGTLNRASMATIINPDDKNAVEAALKLKDATGCKVVVITMGPPPAQGMLRELMAMGADEGILVSAREFGGSDTFATSLIGRLPINVALDLLEEEALEKILVEPKNAITKQYKKLLELDGVKLRFDDEAIKAVAKLSFERKTGARGLRAIMEDVMTDVMYEIPSEDDIKECVITKEAVLDGESPKLIMEDNETKLLTSGEDGKSA